MSFKMLLSDDKSIIDFKKTISPHSQFLYRPGNKCGGNDFGQVS